eukprot:7552431-Pyramimonas_sp.AAC.1
MLWGCTAKTAPCLSARRLPPASRGVCPLSLHSLGTQLPATLRSALCTGRLTSRRVSHASGEDTA